MALLRIDGLSKTFLLHRVNRRVQGCQDIDFAIEPGQFVGITGRSGSGKSTILRCIWRTNLPERGRILYDSQRFGMLDLAQATQRQMLYLRAYELGYVSQFLNALPRQTAYDIVLKSALEAYGADERSRAEEETERMLRHFDLDEGLWELYPRTFSGGEKLRLNIAAAPAAARRAHGLARQRVEAQGALPHRAAESRRHHDARHLPRPRIHGRLVRS